MPKNLDLTLQKPIPSCCICTKPVNYGSKYCPTCAYINYRMKIRRFPNKTRNAIWDFIKKYGYICYYTKTPLELKEIESPWYLEFDHWIPCDNSKVVITSRLINQTFHPLRHPKNDQPVASSAGTRFFQLIPNIVLTAMIHGIVF